MFNILYITSSKCRYIHIPETYVYTYVYAVQKDTPSTTTLHFLVLVDHRSSCGIDRNRMFLADVHQHVPGSGGLWFHHPIWATPLTSSELPQLPKMVSKWALTDNSWTIQHVYPTRSPQVQFNQISNKKTQKYPQNKMIYMVSCSAHMVWGV